MLPQIPFGQRSGLRVPRTSLGGMRLPADVDQAVTVVRHAIDAGMVYIDTSRGYGESEIKIGKALRDGYRERVLLSTKWAPWITRIEPSDDASADCVLRRLEESMRRLDVDVLDFYQVWNLHLPEHYEQARRPGGFLDGVRRARDRGLVRHIGLTSHWKPEELVGMLGEMDWCEVLLVSYNVLNRGYAEVLAKARELGLGTIVMNPVAGGRFAENSAVFRPLLDKLGAVSCADLAIRYVLSNPNIDTLISGVNKIADVDDTLASAARGLFSAEECAEVAAFVDGLSRRNVGFCTACGYCMPCPQEVNIPQVMEAVYTERFLGFHGNAVAHQRLIGNSPWVPGKGAAACTACGTCVPKCTQHLPIPDEMAFAREHLS
jgi:predicted aldo/keto reductase-like oxidoreductase